MDSIVKQVADLGRSNARLLSKQNALLVKLNDTYMALESNRKALCELLSAQINAHGASLGVSPDAIALATEPKEP